MARSEVGPTGSFRDADPIQFTARKLGVYPVPNVNAFLWSLTDAPAKNVLAWDVKSNVEAVPEPV